MAPHTAALLFSAFALVTSGQVGAQGVVVSTMVPPEGYPLPNPYITPCDPEAELLRLEEAEEETASEVKAALRGHVRVYATSSGYGMVDGLTGLPLNLALAGVDEVRLEGEDRFIARARMQVQDRPAEQYLFEFRVERTARGLAVAARRIVGEPVKRGTDWEQAPRCGPGAAWEPIEGR